MPRKCPDAPDRCLLFDEPVLAEGVEFPAVFRAIGGRAEQAGGIRIRAYLGDRRVDPSRPKRHGAEGPVRIYLAPRGAASKNTQRSALRWRRGAAPFPEVAEDPRNY